MKTKDLIIQDVDLSKNEYEKQFKTFYVNIKTLSALRFIGDLRPSECENYMHKELSFSRNEIYELKKFDNKLPRNFV